MKTIAVDLKRAGQVMPEEQVRTTGSAIKIILRQFTLPEYLEEYLDAAEADAALCDPQNQERIPWETLKARLGL